MLYTEVRTIQASDAQVYDILADLPRYHEWNPWICSAQGKVEAGEKLKVTAVMGKLRPVFAHKMIAANRPSLFHWCDLGWFTLLAYGERKRSIQAVDKSSCVYTVELSVTGMAAYLAHIFMGEFMSNGLKVEADALKIRAETKQACTPQN